jgi:hypothetical protein
VTRLSASIWVAAPPEVTFRMVEAPTAPLLPVGGPLLVRLEPYEGMGAVYRWEYQRMRLRFRADSVVTEHRSPERLTFRGTGGWQMDATVSLRPELGGTRVDFQMRYRFPFPLNLLIPGPLIRMGVWYGMRQVKALSEERSGTLPTLST